MTQEQKEEYYNNTERKYRMFFWMTIIFLTQMLVLTVTYTNKQSAESADEVAKAEVAETVDVAKK